MTIQVVPKLLLTSKQKFRFSTCTKTQPLFWCQQEVGNNLNGHPVVGLQGGPSVHGPFVDRAIKVTALLLWWQIFNVYRQITNVNKLNSIRRANGSHCTLESLVNSLTAARFAPSGGDHVDSHQRLGLRPSEW